MRQHGGWTLALTVAGLSAAAWVLTASSRFEENERPPGPSSAPPSQVFTSAHPTSFDAVKDFFNLHRTPVQPVAYTHKVHLANGMECLNCHAGVDLGREAVIPGVKFCMTCHQVIAADRPEIKKVAAYLARGEDIPWQRVYDYSPAAHLRFNHAPHIRAKIGCVTCHGDMTQQTTARRMVDMHMGFCVDCHKLRKASLDCMTCHY